MISALLASSFGMLMTPTPSQYPIQPVPFTQVQIRDQFWSKRIDTLLDVTLDHELHQCEITGRFENFEAAIGKEGAQHRGYTFNDSDVYKVIEAIAFALEHKEDKDLEARTDAIIDLIADSQEDDGYLHSAKTCYQHGIKSEIPATRWTSIAWEHELYNAGHMYEAAVAYFNATGKSKLLTVSLRNADLVCRTFNDDGLVEPPGHQEIEIGLVKLYELTGRQKYLDQAQWFLDQRGRRTKGRQLFGEYAQDHKPVAEQDTAVGHSVRAAYMYSAMADIAAINGRKDYQSALEKIWQNAVGTKLYITGGIGSTGSGEGFTGNYDLPNITAYSETCAAIANMLWNHRLFLLTGEAKYIDVMERSMYNAFLSGYSMEGTSFFYPNPLQSSGSQRSAWFGCACCPPNIARTIASIGRYAYAADDRGLYVNMYMQNSGDMKIGGLPVQLDQTTNYPWDGGVKLTVNPERADRFAVRLRIPGWVNGSPVATDLYRYENDGAARVSLRVNGRNVPLNQEDGYAVIDREWKQGDVIELNLPMEVRRVLAHPEVKADQGRVAIERGPIVYCAEFPDQPDSRVLNAVLRDSARFSSEMRPDLLDGIAVIKTTAGTAARDATGTPQMTDENKPITLIPYYAWSHRGRGEMAVWLATDPKVAWPAPAPTLASTAKVTTSKGTGISNMLDQMIPSSSDDHSVPYFHWWPAKQSTEWVQFDLAKTSTVSKVRAYWFQDAPHGGCRIPTAWRVFYRENGQWKPVAETQRTGVSQDEWNFISFSPVTTDAIKVEVDLGEFSTGIHEIILE